LPQTAQLSDAKRSVLEKYLAGTAATRGVKPIARRPEGALAPLSLSQEELWRRQLRVPNLPLYNECVALHMNGPLQISALEQALTEIIRRHEIWRTTFETKAGRPVQIVHPLAAVRLQILDMRDFPEADRYPETIRQMKDEVRRSLPLQQAPPLRPKLVRTADTEYRLFLIAHQIVLDGASAYQIFPFELAELYKSFLDGRSPALPELPIQCADFACWQRESLSAELGKQIEYWRKRVRADVPASPWPNKKAESRERTYRGAIRPFALSKGISQKLKDFTKREKTTLFSTLLAAFAALLRVYTSQPTIFVGTLSPCGRKRSEVLDLLGYFLNPVALRFDFDRDPTFLELLGQARKVMAEAICHDDVPIEHLARQLKPEDTSPSPFFRAAVSLQPSTPRLDLEWTVTTMDVESGCSPWELYLAFIDRPEGMIGRVQFDPGLLQDEDIDRLLRDFETVLEKVISQAARPLSEIVL
jgi:hypothetical protein